MGRAMEAGAIAYFNGDFTAIENAQVSILTHAFNYGTGIFEGIRGYYNAAEDNVFVFRLAEHIERMRRNMKLMLLEVPEDQARMEAICLELVRKSGFREGVYIRPIAYKSEHYLGPKLQGVDSSFCCYVIKLGDYVDTSAGLDCCVSSWRRLPDNAIPSRAKTTGSYINSSLAATQAQQTGFDESIFLREDGTVAEGSAMNLFIVQEGRLVTPPPNADILVGITRNTLMELARSELGLEVVERPVSRTELYVSDEVFFCGTGAQVAPVRSIDSRPVGAECPGPVSQRLRDLYFEAVLGNNPKYRKWCAPVY